MGTQNQIRMQRREQVKAGQKQPITVEEIDALSIEEADSVRTRINRRFAALVGVVNYGALSGFEGYKLGSADQNAFWIVYHRTTRLVDLISSIFKLAIGCEGLPENFRVTQLKNNMSIFTTEEMPLDQLLILLANDLRAVMKDYGPVVELLYPNMIDQPGVAHLLSLVLEVSEGVRLLLHREQPDGGAYLKSLIQNSNMSDAEAMLQYMEDNAPDFGRPAKRTPLNQYIVDQTKRLAGLHKLQTRAQRVEYLLRYLESHADVKRWKENPSVKLPINASQELQAYQMFYDLDPEERPERLRSIERPPR